MYLFLTWIIVLIMSALMLLEFLTCTILFRLNDNYLSDTALTVVSVILLFQFISLGIIIIIGIHQYIKERTTTKLLFNKFKSNLIK